MVKTGACEIFREIQRTYIVKPIWLGKLKFFEFLSDCKTNHNNLSLHIQEDLFRIQKKMILQKHVSKYKPNIIPSTEFETKHID